MGGSGISPIRLSPTELSPLAKFHHTFTNMPLQDFHQRGKSYWRKSGHPHVDVHCRVGRKFWTTFQTEAFRVPLINGLHVFNRIETYIEDDQRSQVIDEQTPMPPPLWTRRSNRVRSLPNRSVLSIKYFIVTFI